MQMLNMSWPRALLGSRSNVTTSSLVKVTVKIDLSVFLQISEGSSLELFTIEHCLAKKQLKTVGFCTSHWIHEFLRNIQVISFFVVFR